MFRNAEGPLSCKKAARKYESQFEGKWSKKKWEEGYKDTIMKKALIYKFDQNRDLLERLIQTGNSKLVERSPKDPYWGGLLPNSLNKLGDFLAELRDNYIKEKAIFIDGSGLDKIIV
jgi:ribA/ribD-fused uncharacterized protein